jgi:3-phenylpropionate/trans-cinnamate dioxygenase ferredoxin subunit
MLIRRLTQTPLQRFKIPPAQLECAMAQVTIETIKNGPYIVTGEVELIDADGNKYPVEKRMALCRCGASTEKPFCDGTHSKIGFQAAEKAVPESKE